MSTLVRRGLYAALLPAAVAGPYLWMDSSWKQSVARQWENMTQTASSPAEANSSESAMNSVVVGLDGRPLPTSPSLGSPAGIDPGTGGPELAGPRVHDLREVLRFDISPQWITSQWSRVSATLADLDLEGMRVPLVTGTTPSDLAGSLTYYFDANHQVQRICFEGHSGDPRGLVQLATQYYGLQPRPTLSAGLFVSEWNGRPTNLLRLGRPPVLRSDQPYTQVEVVLELNRPSSRYMLSPRLMALLESELKAGRWVHPR